MQQKHGKTDVPKTDARKLVHAPVLKAVNKPDIDPLNMMERLKRAQVRWRTPPGTFQELAFCAFPFPHFLDVLVFMRSLLFTIECGLVIIKKRSLMRTFFKILETAYYIISCKSPEIIWNV